MVSVTLPIGLQSTHGSGTTLSVSSTSTVSELKALIEEVTGIGAAFQGLYVGGSELSSGSSTLGAAGVTSGSALLLVDERAGVGGGPAGLMYVRVVPPAALQATYGNVVSIAASSSTTVGGLKAVISNAIGVSAGSLTASYGGSVLSNDESSCGGSGVPNGGLIYITMSGPAPSSPYVVSVTLPIGPKNIGIGAGFSRTSAIIIPVPSVLQPTFGSTLTLSISTGTTASQLQNVVASVLGVSPTSLTIFFGGALLSKLQSSLGGLRSFPPHTLHRPDGLGSLTIDEAHVLTAAASRVMQLEGSRISVEDFSIKLSVDFTNSVIVYTIQGACELTNRLVGSNRTTAMTMLSLMGVQPSRTAQCRVLEFGGPHPPPTPPPSPLPRPPPSAPPATVTLHALVRFRVGLYSQLALSAPSQLAVSTTEWADRRSALVTMEGTVAVGRPEIVITERLKMVMSSVTFLNSSDSTLTRLVEDAAFRALCGKTETCTSNTSTSAAYSNINQPPTPIRLSTPTARSLSDSTINASRVLLPAHVPSGPPLPSSPPCSPPLPPSLPPQQLFLHLLITQLRRSRTADSIAASEGTSVQLLQQAGALGLVSANVSLTNVSLTGLSAETRLDVTVEENFTLALEAAHQLFSLMNDMSALNVAIEAAGIEAAAVDLVRVSFFHPVEGLVVIESARVIEKSAAQVTVQGGFFSTENTIAMVSTAIVIAVATTVVAALAGTVAGVLAATVGAGATTAGAGAAGGGPGVGGQMGGALPVIMGVQRLELTTGVALEKTTVQTGIAGSVYGVLSNPG